MVSIECLSRGPGVGGFGPLRELLASLPAALAYLAGPDLVFEFASDNYRQAVGGRDLIGRPYHEAIPEIARGPRFTALHEVLQTGETRYARGEQAVVRRPGAEPEPRYLDSVYLPV